MKKIFAILLAAVLTLAGVTPSHATTNTVSWVGNGGYISNGNLYASTQQCDTNGNYLLWIMTANDATTATIDFGNGPLPMTKKAKGSFRYTQTFSGTLPAPASVVATYDGSASNAKLVISHGCNGPVQPPVDPPGECDEDGSDDGDDNESCCYEDEDGDGHNDDGDDEETHNCAALTVTKSVNEPAPAYVGGVIHFTIVVTNSGSVPLTGVTVSDTNATISSCSPTVPASLAVGGSITCDAAHEITEGDMAAGSVKNTASSKSDQVPPKDSNEVTVPLTPAPNLSVTKSQTNTGISKAGDVIRYSIVVQNTGNVPLNNVQVSDANATLGTCSPSLPAKLAVGASVTCSASHTVTAADMTAGQVVNTATASSTEKSGGSNEVLTRLSQSPAVSITKSLTGGLPTAVGDTITYLLVATNTGNVELKNVVISDGNASIQACSISAPVSLSPGASLTCAATHIVTQADMDARVVLNKASVSSNQSSAESNEVTVPLNPAPALSVTKSASGDLPTAVGDVVKFTVEVTNTGNQSMANVTVSDTNAVLESCSPGNPTDLAPGAKLTCIYNHEVTSADMDACQVVNVATASSGSTTATSNQVVVPIDCTPVLSITKELVGMKPNVVGDIITYRINVTNTGEKKLTGVTVIDDNATLESCTPSTPSTLDVAETITCTATHVVTEADVTRGYVDNVAKVKSGNLTVTSNLVRVPIYSTPALGISKRVTGTAAQKAGDKIQYIIVATNTGNLVLTNVAVSDDNAVITSCDKANPVPQLAIGESITCQAYHTVTNADVAAGEVMNTAIATAAENVIATSGTGSGFSSGENGDVKSNMVITKLKATSASGTNNTSTSPKKPKTKKLAFTGGEGPIGHDANDLLLTLVLLTLIGLAVRRRITN